MPWAEERTVSKRRFLRPFVDQSSSRVRAAFLNISMLYHWRWSTISSRLFRSRTSFMFLGSRSMKEPDLRRRVLICLCYRLRIISSTLK